MSIANWPEAERPREKLLARGAAALSDSGIARHLSAYRDAGQSAVEMARQLMLDFGSLSGLLNASLEEFQSGAAWEPPSTHS